MDWWTGLDPHEVCSDGLVSSICSSGLLQVLLAPRSRCRSWTFWLSLHSYVLLDGTTVRSVTGTVQLKLQASPAWLDSVIH